MKKQAPILIIAVLAVVAIVFGSLFFTNSAKMNGQIETLNADVSDRDAKISTLTVDVASRDTQIETLNADVATRDAQIETLNADVASRDAQIETLNADVASRDAQIETLNADVATRDTQIETLNADVATRDAQIETLNADVATRDAQIETLNADATTYDTQISALTADLAGRDAQIDKMIADMAGRDAQINTLTADVASRDAQIEALTADVAGRDAQIEGLNAEVESRDTLIDALVEDVVDRDGQLDELRQQFGGEGASASPEDVLLTVNGVNVLRRDVDQIVTSLTTSYAQAGYNTSDPENAAMIKVFAVETAIQLELMRQKGAELGLDRLSDEELTAIEMENEANWEEIVDLYMTYYGDVTQSSTPGEIAAARADILVMLAHKGYTEAGMLETAVENVTLERVEEHMLADVVVTDEEIRAIFDEKVRQDEAAYKDHIDSYEFVTQYYGQASYYVPEGYRGITHILLEVDPALLSSYNSLAAALQEQVATATDLATTTDLPVTQADVDAAYAAVIASVQPTIDEINRKLAEGVPFAELVAEYGTDPGMEQEPAKSQGYGVHKDSVIWDAAFVQAAFSVDNVGDVAEPVVGTFGVHIVQYTRDVPAGAVEYTDSVQQTLRAIVLEDKQQAAFNTVMESWREEMEVIYSAEVQSTLDAVNYGEVIGTWYLNKTMAGDVTVNAADMEVEVEITLGEDRSAAMNLAGEIFNGVWAPEGEGFVITLDDVPQAFILQDGMLVCEREGRKAFFGREKPVKETFAPGAVRTDAVMADFIGTWKASLAQVQDVQMNAEDIGLNLQIIVTDGKASLSFIQGEEIIGGEGSCTVENGALNLLVEGDAAATGFCLHESGVLSCTLPAVEGQTISIYFEKAE